MEADQLQEQNIGIQELHNPSKADQCDRGHGNETLATTTSTRPGTPGGEPEPELFASCDGQPADTVAVVEAPAAETRAAEAKATDAPAAEAPVTETPAADAAAPAASAAETPAAEAPAAEAPAVEASAAEPVTTPAAEASAGEAPANETPAAEAPATDNAAAATPAAEAPAAKAPVAEAPAADAPAAEAPVTALAAEAPAAETPAAEAPAAEAAKEETPLEEDVAAGIISRVVSASMDPEEVQQHDVEERMAADAPAADAPTAEAAKEETPAAEAPAAEAPAAEAPATEAPAAETAAAETKAAEAPAAENNAAEVACRDCKQQLPASIRLPSMGTWTGQPMLAPLRKRPAAATAPDVPCASDGRLQCALELADVDGRLDELTHSQGAGTQQDAQGSAMQTVSLAEVKGRDVLLQQDEKEGSNDYRPRAWRPPTMPDDEASLMLQPSCELEEPLMSSADGDTLCISSTCGASNAAFSGYLVPEEAADVTRPGSACRHEDGFREEINQAGLIINCCDRCGMRWKVEQPAGTCSHPDGLREATGPDGRFLLSCDICGARSTDSMTCGHLQGFRKQLGAMGERIINCDLCGMRLVEAAEPASVADAKMASGVCDQVEQRVDAGSEKSENICLQPLTQKIEEQTLKPLAMADPLVDLDAQVKQAMLMSEQRSASFLDNKQVRSSGADAATFYQHTASPLQSAAFVTRPPSVTDLPKPRSPDNAQIRQGLLIAGVSEMSPLQMSSGTVHGQPPNIFARASFPQTMAIPEDAEVIPPPPPPQFLTTSTYDGMAFASVSQAGTFLDRAPDMPMSSASSVCRPQSVHDVQTLPPTVPVLQEPSLEQATSDALRRPASSPGAAVVRPMYVPVAPRLPPSSAPRGGRFGNSRSPLLARVEHAQQNQRDLASHVLSSHHHHLSGSQMDSVLQDIQKAHWEASQVANKHLIHFGVIGTADAAGSSTEETPLWGCDPRSRSPVSEPSVVCGLSDVAEDVGSVYEAPSSPSSALGYRSITLQMPLSPSSQLSGIATPLQRLSVTSLDGSSASFGYGGSGYAGYVASEESAMTPIRVATPPPGVGAAGGGAKAVAVLRTQSPSRSPQLVSQLVTSGAPLSPNAASGVVVRAPQSPAQPGLARPPQAPRKQLQKAESPQQPTRMLSVSESASLAMDRFMHPDIVRPELREENDGLRHQCENLMMEVMRLRQAAQDAAVSQAMATAQQAMPAMSNNFNPRTLGSRDVPSNTSAPPAAAAGLRNTIAPRDISTPLFGESGRDVPRQ